MADTLDRVIQEALKLEDLTVSQRIQEANDKSNDEEKSALSKAAQSGLVNSGKFLKQIADIHFVRARRFVEARLDARRETLQRVPDVASPELFDSLLNRLHKDIELILASIPDHARRRQGPDANVNLLKRFQDEESTRLKSIARTEVERMRSEAELKRLQTAATPPPPPAPESNEPHRTGSSPMTQATTTHAPEAKPTWLSKISSDVFTQVISGTLLTLIVPQLPALRSKVEPHFPDLWKQVDLPLWGVLFGVVLGSWMPLRWVVLHFRDRKKTAMNFERIIEQLETRDAQGQPAEKR